jgi:hypothetical protein
MSVELLHRDHLPITHVIGTQSYCLVHGYFYVVHAELSDYDRSCWSVELKIFVLHRTGLLTAV